MKNMFTAAIAALALMSAAPAFAQSWSAEVARADSNVTDATALELNYSNDLVGRFDYNLEGTVVYQDTTGDVATVVAAGVSTPVKAPFGVTVTPAVEVGGVLTGDDTFGFWGVEVNASRPLFGRFSGNVGLRHREGFDDADMNEDRVAVGVDYALTDKSSLGVVYYDVNGHVDAQVLGVVYKARF